MHPNKLKVSSKRCYHGGNTTFRRPVLSFSSGKIHTKIYTVNNSFSDPTHCGNISVTLINKINSWVYFYDQKIWNIYTIF